MERSEKKTEANSASLSDSETTMIISFDAQPVANIEMHIWVIVLEDAKQKMAFRGKFPRYTFCETRGANNQIYCLGFCSPGSTKHLHSVCLGIIFTEQIDMLEMFQPTFIVDSVIIASAIPPTPRSISVTDDRTTYISSVAVEFIEGIHMKGVTDNDGLYRACSRDLMSLFRHSADPSHHVSIINARDPGHVEIADPLVVPFDKAQTVNYISENYTVKVFAMRIGCDNVCWADPFASVVKRALDMSINI